MIRTHKNRLEALELAHAARLPVLPALVVTRGQDPEAERAAFVLRHGRPPDLVVVVKIVDASVPEPDEAATHHEGID